MDELDEISTTELLKKADESIVVNPDSFGAELVAQLASRIRFLRKAIERPVEVIEGDNPPAVFGEGTRQERAEIRGVQSYC